MHVDVQAVLAVVGGESDEPVTATNDLQAVRLWLGGLQDLLPRFGWLRLRPAKGVYGRASVRDAHEGIVETTCVARQIYNDVCMYYLFVFFQNVSFVPLLLSHICL